MVQDPQEKDGTSTTHDSNVEVASANLEQHSKECSYQKERRARKNQGSIVIAICSSGFRRFRCLERWTPNFVCQGAIGQFEGGGFRWSLKARGLEESQRSKKGTTLTSAFSHFAAK